MSVDARRLQAGRGQVGRPCEWCGLRLDGGDDAAICIACDALHHTACWKQYGGCGWRGCMNEPPSRRETAPAPRPRPDYRSAEDHCPQCGGGLPRDPVVCPHCGARMAHPDGAVPRPERFFRRVTVQEASTALVSGLVGLVFLGFVFGPIAIVNARRAFRRIESNRRKGDDLYVGTDMARAGLWLGAVATVLHLGLLLLYVLAVFDPERYNPYLPVKIPPDTLQTIQDALFGDWRFTRGDG